MADSRTRFKRSASSPLPRLLVGRMAAVLMAAGAILSVTAELVSGHFDQRMFFSVGAPLILGGVLWFLPWERLGVAATVGFFLFSIAALVLGDAAAGPDTHPESVPVFVIALFAWSGLAHGRWMSLILSPVVMLVYFFPLVSGGKEVSDTFGLVFTISMGILVGEAIAWITDKLTTAENETLMAEHREDFLRSAQHELRTPLTTVSGYAKLLRDRNDVLTDAQRWEFADGILRGSERMNKLLDRLDQLQNDTDEEVDLEPLGLLAPHYGDGKLDLSDPVRGSSRAASADFVAPDESEKE